MACFGKSKHASNGFRKGKQEGV